MGNQQANNNNKSSGRYKQQTIVLDTTSVGSSDSTDTDTIHSSSEERSFVSAFELAPDDFTLIEPPLGHSATGTTYKALWNKESGEKHEVAIKFYNLPKDCVAEFSNQISSIGILPYHDNLVRFYGGWAKPRFAIVTELMAGSLYDSLSNGKIRNKLDSVLNLSLQIARGVEHLHKHNITHLSLKSRNVMFDSANAVKISDFGTAEWRHDFDGTQYMSPELLAGSDNITNAADVYSYAIILYEILTGKLLPNVDASNDRSRIAQAASSLRPRMEEHVSIYQGTNEKIVEQMLVVLIFDCLSEDPTKRPTMTEIIVSLERLAQALKDPSTICHLSRLASQESKPLYESVFMIPTDKLYGRDIELSRVTDIFHSNAAAKGNICVFIGGVSGIGKSAFVKKAFQELTRSLNKEEYSFHSGKYDQLKTGVPYAGIMECFRSVIMARIIAPSQANPNAKKKWKKQLLKGLGKNAQLIVDVLPEIKHIIGEQKPVPELAGDDAVQRFTETFSAFVELLATSQHKLVIFVDDLQWADASSFKLIQALLRNPWFLFVGAFRNNEISPGHPLIAMQASIKKQGVKIHEFTLVPPSVKEMNQLCRDTFRCNEEYSMPLTQLIYEKTQGNCFFFIQYLSSLHSAKIITYSNQQWRWDLKEIEERGFPDNIVDFMLSKLRHQLSKKSQYILQLASCLGSTFQFQQLCTMAEQVVIGDGSTVGSITEADLQELIINNYIQKASAVSTTTKANLTHNLDNIVNIGYEISSLQSKTVAYSFTHDRIQQSAYGLFNGQKVDVKQVRKSVGMVLLHNAQQQNSLTDAIFDIVSNLNISINLFVEVDELFKLAELNLLASQQSRKSTDYQSALRYGKIAYHVLFEMIAARTATAEEDQEACIWRDDRYYEFAFQLCLLLQQLEYVTNKNIENGELYFEKLIKYARNPAELCPAYYEKARILEVSIKYKDVIATGLECLRINGEVEAANHWLNPTEEQIEALYKKIKRALEDKDFEQLKNMSTPRGKAPVVILAYDMIQTAASMEMMVNPTYYGAFRMTEICLDNDIVQNSSFNAWALFSLMVVNRFRDYALGKTIVETINKYTPGVLDRIEYADLYTTFCMAWSHPLSQVIKTAHGRNSRLAKSEGNMKIFIYQFSKTMITDVISCPSAQEYVLKWNAIYEGVDAISSGISVGMRPPTAMIPLTDAFPERVAAEFEALVDCIPIPHTKLSFYVLKALRTYVMDEHDQSLKALVDGAQPNMSIIYHETSVEATVYVVEVLNRCHLIANGGATSLAPAVMKEHLKHIDEKIEMLKIFATETLRVNFAHYYHLALAERARAVAAISRTTTNNKTKARTSTPEDDFCIKQYEEALAITREGKWLCFEGITLELLAQYCQEKGLNDLFKRYINESYAAFHRWEAKRKLDLMRHKYGEEVFAAMEESLAATSKANKLNVSLYHAASTNDVCAIRDFISKYGHSALLEQQKEGSGSRNTPLHAAAAQGCTEAVVALLETLAKPSPIREKALNGMYNIQGYLPLHLAIKNENFTTAAVLIKEGADIAARTKKEHWGTALHEACKHANMPAVQFLLERMPTKDIMIRNKTGDTPLLTAAKNNRIEVVQLMVRHLEQQHLAASSDMFAGVVSYKDSRGYNMFHIAVESKNYLLVKALFSLLGGQHQQKHQKHHHQTLCLSMLGAREKRQQLTPLLFAVLSISSGSGQQQQQQCRAIAVEMLAYLHSVVVRHRQHDDDDDNDKDHTLRRDVQAIVNAADANNLDTPLHIAIQRKDQELAHSLVSLGAQVSATNKNKETPLSLAKKLGVQLSITMNPSTAAATTTTTRTTTDASINAATSTTRTTVQHASHVADKIKLFSSSSSSDKNKGNNNNNNKVGIIFKGLLLGSINNNNNKKPITTTTSSSSTQLDASGNEVHQQSGAALFNFADMTFEEFFEDALMRPYLRKLCEKEFSVENFDFLIEVAEYRKIPTPEQRKEHAAKIYETYVSSNAKMMLNIEDHLRRELKAALAQIDAGAAQAHDKLFENIEREARITLLDTYTRFLRHDLCKECVKAKQKQLAK